MSSSDNCWRGLGRVRAGQPPDRGPGGAGAAAGGRAQGHRPRRQVAPVEDPHACRPHLQPLR